MCCPRPSGRGESRSGVAGAHGTSASPSPLHATHGANYAIHSHHIFPTSVLYLEGYEADNHLHKKLVNEIANRAFLTGSSNISLSNSKPADYLPAIEKRYPGGLAKQFVPTSPELWEPNRYEDFLQERRRLIAEAINALLDVLEADIETEVEKSARELAALGESPILEYKSSLRWDFRETQVNKALQKVIAKTVAGFLNTEGGTLLIGVADNGSIVGIENDLKTLSTPDADTFEQTFRNVLTDHLGPEYSHLVTSAYEVVDSMTVTRVAVEQSPKPVFPKDKGTTEFFVRIGNTTKPLDHEAMHDYIKMHWET